MMSLSLEVDKSLSGLDVTSVANLLLLEQEREVQQVSFRIGIKSIDAHFPRLWHGGSVIGVGYAEDGDKGRKLSTHILATALVSPSTSLTTTQHRGAASSDATEVFVLAPPTSTIISDLHALLQSRLPATISGTSEEGAMQLLDNVKLLQYLDLAGLAEGLSETSQTLHDQQQEADRKAVLLVKGMSSTLSLAQRRGGTVQVAALAANLLRTLTHLSRSYPRVLVLVEFTVETGTKDSDEGGDLESAFVGEKGGTMTITPLGVLGGVLEHGMDAVVVVHEGFGKTRKSKPAGAGIKTRIVEAVKDRLGATRGEWCIWVQ